MAAAALSGTMPASAADQALMDRAVKHLVSNYSPQSKKVGWIMLASILVEAWDLYSIAFVLIYLKDIFNPSPFLLGFAAAGTQAGAIIGALLGGWLSDRIGRRVVFLSTMIMFVVLAAAQAFSPDMLTLAILRVLLGIPLGSDISAGYSYIMEFLPRGEREVVGNRWQFMFAIGQVITLMCIAILIIAQLPHDMIWRVTLGLGAVPALIIFVLRHRLPETAIWLIRHGRFREAKQVAAEMYHDRLDMLPDRDVKQPKPKAMDFIADTRKDPIRWRATLFGWIACACEGLEFSTFAFYIPVILAMVGVSGNLGTCLVTMGLYCVASVSGWVGPLITPKIGQRGLSMWGFGIVFIGLLIAAAALWLNYPYAVAAAAALVLWGHYWDAENCMTIPTMVAKPIYRGTASGFAYIFVKLPSFLGILLFPALFDAVGKPAAP